MDSLADNQEKAEQVAEIMKALAHPIRLRILAVLSRGELNVTELAQRLGIPQPHASLHLGVLRNHGVLNSRRDGPSVRYSLARKRLKELVEYLEGCPA